LFGWVSNEVFKPFPLALFLFAAQRVPSNRHQPIERATRSLNNFLGFPFALFFSVYPVHPAVVSPLGAEFVGDYGTYQVFGRGPSLGRRTLAKRHSCRKKNHGGEDAIPEKM
jgi:hypothetical protein